MTAPEPRRTPREAAAVEWRRRYASYATPPRDCGCPHAFHPDPLDCLARPPAPSTFSLDAAELAAEVTRHARGQWQLWELAERFDLTQVAAA